jgi:hypothetical protein
MFDSITSSGTTISTGTYAGDRLWVNTNPCGEISLTPNGHTLTTTTYMNKVSNQFVAVFKIERNDKNEITSAKFIKELWIETKNGSSVDFEVAKDKDISKYEANEIAIRTIYTVAF